MSGNNLIFLNTVRTDRADRMKANAQVHCLFDTVEEMDEHVSQFVHSHGDKLSDTALILLSVLTGHSCVVPGVSWLTVKSMAEMVGVVERTIQNALKLLEQSGIINRVQTNKSNGSQGSNYVIIQRMYEKSEESEIAHEEIQAAHQQVAAGSEGFTPNFTDTFRGRFTEQVTQSSINSLNLVNPSTEEEEYIYKAFRQQITFFEVPNEIENQIIRSVPKLLTYSVDALHRTFKKMMLRVREGSLYNIAQWFASTIIGEEFYLSQQRKEAARNSRLFLR